MKRACLLRPGRRMGVAPRAGAWIETPAGLALACSIWSPPARGRGLKLGVRLGGRAIPESPPARGRGLKRSLGLTPQEIAGRPPRGGVD